MERADRLVLWVGGRGAMQGLLRCRHTPNNNSMRQLRTKYDEGEQFLAF